MSIREIRSVTDLENRKDDISFIRVTWVDFTNTVRCRILPFTHFSRLLSYKPSTFNKQIAIPEPPSSNAGDYAKRGGITITKAALGLVYIACAPGFPSSGEWLYVPDLSSVYELPYSPGHISVMGFLQEKEPVKNEAGLETVDVSLCSRALLKKVLEEALKEYSATFFIGFETEVILIKSLSPLKAVNDYGWSENPSLSAGTVEAVVTEEIAKSLMKAGIDLQMYHSESSPGQFEFVTGPLPPMEAVDALIATREIIYNVASKHGLKATLAPRVYNDNCGSASHVHISIKSTNPKLNASVQVPSAPSLTQLEVSFLQGMLDHLQAATVFTMPTPQSYARAIDGVWSGGTYVTWGRDNREAPIRLCGRTGNYNFEVKSLDGTANPYIAVAALLQSGMFGVKASSELIAKDCQVLAASLSESARRELGITKRMPLKIEEARRYLLQDKQLTDFLGSEFVEKYLAVNELLGKSLEGASDEETMIRYIKKY